MLFFPIATHHPLSLISNSLVTVLICCEFHGLLRAETCASKVLPLLFAFLTSTHIQGVSLPFFPFLLHCLKPLHCLSRSHVLVMDIQRMKMSIYVFRKMVLLLAANCSACVLHTHKGFSDYTVCSTIMTKSNNNFTNIRLY